MSAADNSLDAFLDRDEPVIRLELADVRGSSPRNAGTVMYVAGNTLWGTIGGGRLEFMVIERARAMLTGGTLADHMDIPLGPEIGQCCGGRVQVSLARMTLQNKIDASVCAQKAKAGWPHVYVMGAGHVGRALADLFQHLPVRCVLVDTRADELAQCSAKVETRLSAIPEFDIKTAPRGSAFVVLTHDHALDFLLTAEALRRGDAWYVGMIGSATKRAKFASWCRELCDDLKIEDLTCPIGASGSRDKRPSVIAAFVAAEVIAELTSAPATTALIQGCGLPDGSRSTGRKRHGTYKPSSMPRPMGGGTHHERPKLHV